MSKIWVPLGGGSGITSDDLSLTKDKVPAGYTFVGADTNDEKGIGTAATVPALTVGTNGRTLIPKGFSFGNQYASNSQATMNGGTWNPQAYQQTIYCAGCYMNQNVIINAYVDYSYLITGQVTF